MTYQNTLDWLFTQLPMYQNQGKIAYKANLDNTYLLANYLKNPEKKFKSVHVAGTNGKGSTSHMIASVLQQAGYKVGLYTSPHLKDFRERIKINGKEVSEQFVINFIEKNKPFFQKKELSFFEMTVGMAFDYFAIEKVDIAVIEVGMGGRLDSTNIITPEVSVITNIGLDHTQFLGTTLTAIAKEKGGIIKAGIPVVIGETQIETKSVFKDIAEDVGSPISFADKIIKESFQTDLLGDYQVKNVRTAVAVLQLLNKKQFSISLEQIKRGLLNVIKNTHLKGRWQIVQFKPKVICDTAHNKEGLIYTIEQLKKETFNKLHIVFGIVSDKDLSLIIDLLPKIAEYYFCKPNIARGLLAGKLKEAFVKKGYRGEQYNSVQEAYNSALYAASEGDVVYVGGSTFVVSEII